MVLQQRVQLGEFILCPVNQHLEIGAERIPLEPKVYQVLCYLISQQQRFVSLEELHQQVWAGRVVSDTAVRRSISKLRAAFLDRTGARPLYSVSRQTRLPLAGASEPVATAVIPEATVPLSTDSEPHHQPQPSTSHAEQPEQRSIQLEHIPALGTAESLAILALVAIVVAIAFAVAVLAATSILALANRFTCGGR